jgi:hypothetical protein
MNRREQRKFDQNQIGAKALKQLKLTVEMEDERPQSISTAFPFPLLVAITDAVFLT